VPSATLTVLTTHGTNEVRATVDDGRVALDRDALRAATGWDARPEGLCRGDVCVPLPAGTDPTDLATVAAALRLPLATELDAAVVALGDAADERAAAMATLDAPPFELPAVAGGTVSLEQFAGRKRVLLAWASW
jgi:hypothetical protein